MKKQQSYQQQNQSIQKLYNSGAHLFRCEPDKSPAEGGENWKTAEPGLDELLDHHGLIGFVPSSLNLVVVDVDHGGENAVVRLSELLGEPQSIVRTHGKHKGYHLYYPAPDDLDYPSKNYKFEWGKGEVRSNGYVILWEPQKAVEAYDKSEDATPPDLTPILPVKRERKENPKDYDPPSFEDVDKALSRIPIEIDYDGWREVGMALHSCGDEYLELWEKWSREWRAYEEGATAKKWATFKDDGGITIGTLFRLAYPDPEWLDDEFLQRLQEGLEKPKEKKRDGLIIEWANTIKPKPIDWLIEGWLSRGTLHIIAGATGGGKSIITNYLASQISKGEPLFDGTPTKAGKTLIYSSEENIEQLTIPRLHYFGGDLSNIGFLRYMVRQGEEFYFDPSRDLDLLENALESNPDVSLIILDPIFDLIPSKMDAYREDQIRKAVAPLQKLIRRHNVAAIGIMHFRKETKTTRAIDKISGSSVWTKIARVSYLVDLIEKKRDYKRGIISPLVESRNLPLAPESYEYEILEKPFRFEWGNPVDGTADELYEGTDGRTTREAPKKEIAENWLFDYLLVRHGAKWQDVLNDAKGYGHSKTTLERVRNDMKNQGRIIFDKNKSNEWKLSE